MRLYYTGRLANGKVFDSTTTGNGFKFKLGKKEVISGWDVGLRGMLCVLIAVLLVCLYVGKISNFQPISCDVSSTQTLKYKYPSLKYEYKYKYLICTVSTCQVCMCRPTQTC